MDTPLIDTPEARSLRSSLLRAAGVRIGVSYSGMWRALQRVSAGAVATTSADKEAESIIAELKAKGYTPVSDMAHYVGRQKISSRPDAGSTLGVRSRTDAVRRALIALDRPQDATPATVSKHLPALVAHIAKFHDDPRASRTVARYKK